MENKKQEEIKEEVKEEKNPQEETFDEEEVKTATSPETN